MANEFRVGSGIIAPKAQLGDGSNNVAPLNLAPGFSVAAPQEGDLWTTVSGLWIRSGGLSLKVATGATASDGSVTEQIGSDIAGQVRIVSASFSVSTLTSGFVYYYFNDSSNLVAVTFTGAPTIRMAGQSTSTSISMLPYGEMSIWCRPSAVYVISGNIL